MCCVQPHSNDETPRINRFYRQAFQAEMGNLAKPHDVKLGVNSANKEEKALAIVCGLVLTEKKTKADKGVETEGTGALLPIQRYGGE